MSFYTGWAKSGYLGRTAMGARADVLMIIVIFAAALDFAAFRW